MRLQPAACTLACSLAARRSARHTVLNAPCLRCHALAQCSQDDDDDDELEMHPTPPFVLRASGGAGPALHAVLLPVGLLCRCCRPGRGSGARLKPKLDWLLLRRRTRSCGTARRTRRWRW